MIPIVDCRKYQFPEVAKVPGHVDQHAFRITSAGFSIVVLYVREPFINRDVLGVHVSISYCVKRKPCKVTNKMIAAVQRLIEQQGLPWPARYKRELFSSGPFAGKGVHLYEIEPERNDEP